MATPPMVGFKLLRRNFQYKVAWTFKMDFYYLEIGVSDVAGKFLVGRQTFVEVITLQLSVHSVVRRRLAQRRALQHGPLANGRRTSGGATFSPSSPQASTSELCFPVASPCFPCVRPTCAFP